ADEGSAGVGGAVDVLQILLADGAHVAERVHRQLAIRVPAGLAGLDIQARKLEPSHGETRDVLVRHAQADRHAVEAAARVDGALELIDADRKGESHHHNHRADADDVYCTKEKDRKSTRLNSSHVATSYAVLCLIK